MIKESIPDQGASLNERVLFYRGNILVDAVFEKLTAMSAAELRDLSQALPLPAGNTRNLPALPAYLPETGLREEHSQVCDRPGRTGENKLAASRSNWWTSAKGAEVALGTYETSDGHATLILISYPTPQIAAEHLRQIDAARQPNPTQPAGSPAATEHRPGL